MPSNTRSNGVVLPSTGTILYMRRNDSLYATEKPYQTVFNPRTNKARATNVAFDEFAVTVSAIKDSKTQFDLNTCGFEMLSCPTKVRFDKDLDLSTTYIPEMERFLKRHLDAKRVVVWNSQFRSAVLDSNTDSSVILPARYLHVDQTSNSSIKRLLHHMGVEASDLLSKRFQIVNIWRPLSEGPLENWPLMVCDHRTIKSSDLEAVDLVTLDDYIGESYFLHHNPDHKFYHTMGQTSDDVLLMKMFDSKDIDENGHPIAKCCPHGSFPGRSMLDGARTRKSVELRAFVFY